jgi:hypothetical protein
VCVWVVNDCDAVAKALECVLFSEQEALLASVLLPLRGFDWYDGFPSAFSLVYVALQKILCKLGV